MLKDFPFNVAVELLRVEQKPGCHSQNGIELCEIEGVLCLATCYTTQRLGLWLVQNENRRGMP